MAPKKEVSLFNSLILLFLKFHILRKNLTRNPLILNEKKKSNLEELAETSKQGTFHIEF